MTVEIRRTNASKIVDFIVAPELVRLAARTLAVGGVVSNPSLP